jgi:hypothetical protein
MKDLQKVATRLFISSSIFFGVVGVTIMLIPTNNGEDPAEWLFKLLGATGFTVLSSFAVSVGLKYLSSSNK